MAPYMYMSSSIFVFSLWKSRAGYYWFTLSRRSRCLLSPTIWLENLTHNMWHEKKKNRETFSLHIWRSLVRQQIYLISIWFLCFCLGASWFASLCILTAYRTYMQSKADGSSSWRARSVHNVRLVLWWSFSCQVWVVADLHVIYSSCVYVLRREYVVERRGESIIMDKKRARVTEPRVRKRRAPLSHAVGDFGKCQA